VTEAENQFRVQYSIEGLKRSLGRNHQRNSREMIEHMTGELYEHIADARIYDDISIMVIKQRRGE
jgi:serine phosphatase RsbU (regulator of sigma subunit)